MSPLLIAFLGVLLVPLFVATWRTSLLGLACQGGLMAWLAYRLGADPRTLDGLITLTDLAIIRGCVAPLALYRVLRAHNLPPRNDVIPPNLLSWTLALGIVLVAFNFAASLVPEFGQRRIHVAVAASALMLAFLVLATQSGTFSQIIGALRFENGIALFELGGTAEHAPVGIAVGRGLVVLATVLFYRWYLKNLAARSPADAPEAAARPAV